MTISGLGPSPPPTPDSRTPSGQPPGCLPQRIGAHLCEGLDLAQHGPGRGLESLGRLSDPALSGCDRLLQGLHLLAQGPRLGLLRLQGDGELRQGLAGRSEGQNP